MENDNKNDKIYSFCCQSKLTLLPVRCDAISILNNVVQKVIVLYWSFLLRFYFIEKISRRKSGWICDILFGAKQILFGLQRKNICVIFTEFP